LAFATAAQQKLELHLKYPLDPQINLHLYSGFHARTYYVTGLQLKSIEYKFHRVSCYVEWWQEDKLRYRAE